MVREISLSRTKASNFRTERDLDLNPEDYADYTSNWHIQATNPNN